MSKKQDFEGFLWISGCKNPSELKNHQQQHTSVCYMAPEEIWSFLFF